MCQGDKYELQVDMSFLSLAPVAHEMPILSFLIPTGVPSPCQTPGQTTQLGEPKPESGRGGRRGAGGGGASGGGAATGANEDIRDPRAEAPLDDRTGTYAGMGVIIGAFLGWVSQFV